VTGARRHSKRVRAHDEWKRVRARNRKQGKASAVSNVMQQDLIMDVGMHTGQDTEFYIAKGFRVAAVEANPDLANRAKTRFANYLADGRLRIYNVAIADHAGPVRFWVNDQKDDWGTINAGFAQRNAKSGTTAHEITVESVRFEDILDECGTPYYLKIDIEGSDLLCLNALRRRELPKYLSFEAEVDSMDQVFNQLSVLWNLGYRQFKFVNQGLNRRIRCPEPAREGQYVDARFDDFSSGLFGEELSGKWLSADEAIGAARPLVRDQRYFGLNAPYSRSLWGRAYRGFRRLTGNPVAWYDIHATIGGR
jgi:FkbM family methyltransferase